MSKTIVIIVSPEGETKIETKGFSGSQCREASSFIEEALGQQTSERLTAEYYHEQSSKSQLREHL